MKATVNYIKQRFDAFNIRMFGGSLPMPTVELSNSKSMLGQCVTKRRAFRKGRGACSCTLRISTRAEFSPDELDDVIIHEMIHYYIAFHGIKDTAPHGKVFREWMERVNKHYGRHVTVSHRMTDAEKEEMVDTRPRWHVVAVIRFLDGRTGIKVLPRTVRAVLNYYNGAKTNNMVESIRFFFCRDPYFNRYPTSSVLRAHLIEWEEAWKRLKDCREISCDGKTVK